MRGLHLVLAGAATGNGNRGVEALARSVIDAVDRHSPHSVLSVFDDGWGVRELTGRRDQHTRVEYIGVRRSRRWHRPESWARIQLAQAVGLGRNPAAQRLSDADAILDLSAGDSFTDLYGPARLATVSAPKRAALRAGRPLVLLPQTYGPFETGSGRRQAERLIRSAALAYARDPRSYARLLELAGPDADRGRLRQGVDVAFALEPRRPTAECADLVEGLAEGLVVGVNVSGLLWNATGHARFGLLGDYLETMTAVVRGLLARGAHVLFVPHVHDHLGAGESDVTAAKKIRERLTDEDRARTTVLPDLGAAELKWCIGQTDWFVGSRMHSTIAALSTLTPATAYAYSDKTLGVFESCGMGEHVIDARSTAGRKAAEEILAGFDRRTATREELQMYAPATIDMAREQLRSVLDAVMLWRDSATQVGAIA